MIMTMATLLKTFERARKRRFYKYGIPFLALVVGGSFGLKEFAQLRYTFTKREMLTKEQAAELGIRGRKELTSIEEEYGKTLEQVQDTLEEWENIRGPRPWEDSKSVQELEREMAKVKPTRT